MCKDESNVIWIQELPSVLYTNKEEFSEGFVTDITEDEVRKLRKDINEYYNIKELFGSELSEFTGDFYNFPHYEEINSGFMGSLRFEPVAEALKLSIEKDIILYIKALMSAKDYEARKGNEAP